MGISEMIASCGRSLTAGIPAGLGLTAGSPTRGIALTMTRTPTLAPRPPA